MNIEKKVIYVYNTLYLEKISDKDESFIDYLKCYKIT